MPERPADCATPGSASDEVEALYQGAVAAWNKGDWARAEAGARAAIGIDPQRAALHYLLGCCRLEQERPEAATGDFECCLALAPPHPLHGEATARRALSLARIDSSGGRAAPVLALSTADVQAVSIVICSAQPERFARVEAMYRRLFAAVPHEIIGIHDARSLAEGYNRALRRARHEVIVFSHDDIDIVSPDFAALLLPRMKTYGLLGVAGTTQMVGGAWHFAGHPNLRGQVGMPDGDAGYTVTVYGVEQPVSDGLQALDGLLFAVHRDIASRLGFDEAAFDAWHLYDLDFSLRAARSGVPCGTCNDVLVAHASQGRYDGEWLRYAQRFMTKHHEPTSPMQAVFPQPVLVSLPLRTAGEWRLMTGHLMSS